MRRKRAAERAWVRKMTAGVCLIRNKANNKLYVGSSDNIKKRWGSHISKLRCGSHENSKLQNAWNKYLEPSFEFSVIEIIENKNFLLDAEQSWINILLHDWSVAYNICPAAASPLGRKHSQASKDKMASIRTGKKHSLETREKIRQAHIGKKRTEEARKNMSKWQFGRILSEEHKQKISETMKKKFGK